MHFMNSWSVNSLTSIGDSVKYPFPGWIQVARNCCCKQQSERQSPLGFEMSGA